MKKSSFILSLVVVSVCYLCIARTAIAISIPFFLVSLFLLLMSYCYFEHALFFREWRTATSGKRRTPPGQAFAIGTVLLVIAAILMYVGVQLVLWSLK